MVATLYFLMAQSCGVTLAQQQLPSRLYLLLPSINYWSSNPCAMEMYGMTGERLGTIGVSEQRVRDNLPRWQRDFLAKPSISIRKGIAWSFQPPYEDADVLVLTAPSSKFVDIRLPIFDHYDESRPLFAHAAFWAFSGTSKTSFPTADDGFAMPLAAHCVWKHDLDSRGPGIQDEGDMFLLQNGDAMEVGIMQNFKTGKMELYKEYWTEPEPTSGDENESKLPCLAAETINHDGDWQGLIIRVGRYCQGIVKPGNGREGVLIERLTQMWESGTWARDSRGGHSESVFKYNPDNPDLRHPCLWLCEENRNLEDRFVSGGVKWRVTEVLR